MKSVNRKVPFQCTKCPKHYWTKYAFKAHMNVTHEEVKRYKCYFCSFAFFKNSHIIQHMSKHTKEKPYKCQYCLQSFQEERSVKKHKDGISCNRKQTHPLLSPCYFCDKAFSCTTAINHHIKSVHLLERNHKCQLCSKRLGSNSALNEHIQSVHTKENSFKCYFCLKSFVNFGRLRKHTWLHTREKPLTCYFCQKDLSDPHHISDHIRNFHTKERPFKCTECPSRCYSSKGTLNAHAREKHGIRVHQ
jgi:hypothetical protein